MRFAQSVRQPRLIAGYFASHVFGEARERRFRFRQSGRGINPPEVGGHRLALLPRDCRILCTMQSCTCVCGKTDSIASRKPLSPSTQAMKQLRQPRLFSSVGKYCSQHCYKSTIIATPSTPGRRCRQIVACIVVTMAPQLQRRRSLSSCYDVQLFSLGQSGLSSRG